MNPRVSGRMTFATCRAPANCRNPNGFASSGCPRRKMQTLSSRHNSSDCVPGCNALGSGNPYLLGNGVPTNDGQTQAVPWNYGTAGYVPQGYPLARTFEVKLRYRT